jgi:hypothetical protein
MLEGNMEFIEFTLYRALGLIIGGNFGLFILPIILHACFGVPYIS